jgi:hypothetical protein
MVDQRVGAWAFILGVIVAIIAGIVAATVAATSAWVVLLLVILGLIVGFLNIGDKQITGFLIAAIALMVLGATSGTTVLGELNILIAGLGTLVNAILVNIAIFVAPAALVVALKEVIKLSKAPGS